ncbi:MAG: hypothetical protein CMJ31_01980 [Phycisphaerae bacterium]|nr:hypothetical protein [Phycisphaerae bacterium]
MTADGAGSPRTPAMTRHTVRVMAPSRRVVHLAFNDVKPSALEAATRVRALIERHAEFAGHIDVHYECDTEAIAKSDLICVVGGDGTLLAAARRLLGTGVPILGVNAGRVGFMAAFDPDAFEARAADLLEHAPLPLRTVRALSATVSDGDGGATPLEAINEMVITAGPPFRMISLEIAINGEPGPVVNGDGLIVSTPLGSTAYNVSAGGPIVAPDAPVTVITPIAAHSLAFRPIVLSEDDRVSIRVARGNDDGDIGTTLVADGQIHKRLHPGAEVVIEGPRRSVDFVMNPETTYLSTLMKKLHWAVQPAAQGRPPQPPER